jgi:hypothetical protein
MMPTFLFLTLIVYLVSEWLVQPDIDHQRYN